jgi:hypothetical protein
MASFHWSLHVTYVGTPEFGIQIENTCIDKFTHTD